MKSIEIKGTVRTDVGKKATHELRKNNGVPCVLYGVQKDENGLPVATHFSVPTEGLRNLVYTPHIYVVDLNIDGKIVNAILKDIQFHPVTDAILHVDFYQIDEAKPIVMEVPVQLEGLAEGVRAGGKLALQLRKLKVKALYNVMANKDCTYDNANQSEFAEIFSSAESYRKNYDYNAGDIGSDTGDLEAEFLSDPSETPEEFGQKIEDAYVKLLEENGK